MRELPLLVVHGAVVWKVLLLALVLVSLVVVALLRFAWTRLWTRIVVRARVREVAAVVEGHACVRGRLRGGWFATHVRGRTRRDHAEGRPFLECEDGARIELVGSWRVLAGTRAAVSRLGAPKGTPSALADRGRGVLRVVDQDAEVVARGVATRVAIEHADYRESASTWRMTGGDISALACRTRSRPAHPIVVMIVIAVATTAWYRELQHIGASALARTRRGTDRATAPEIEAFGDFAIAAAMPGSRDDALLDASEVFENRYHNVGSLAELHDAIDAQVDVCRSALRQLREGRLDAALATAHVCGFRKLEAYIQLFLGDYLAARTSPQPAVRGHAAIALGDWRQAAEAAETQGDSCRAAWYRNLAGIATAAPASTGPRCAIYAALVLPGEQRRARLRALFGDPDVGEDARLRRLVGALARTEGIDVEPNRHFYINDGIDAVDWLAPHQPASIADPRSLIRVAVVRGDFAAARRIAATLTGDERDAFELWLALREGHELPAVAYVHPGLETAATLRAGKLPDDPREISGVYPTCVADLRSAVATAVRDGDGGPFARVLAECGGYYTSLPHQLFGILPRVSRHRAELADALRMFRESLTTFDTSHLPFFTLDRMAEYRDHARLVGDIAEADRWQAIIDRHARALASRDRAIAFALESWP